MALTLKKVAKLVRKGERGRHSDNGGLDGVKGLRLVVAGKNAAHYELRFQLHGRVRWMGLGSARTFTLDQVRQRAKAARQLLTDKIDPLDTRRAERANEKLAAVKTLTFGEAAQQYFDQNEAKWRNPKHRAQFIGSLRVYVFPIIGDLPVAALDTGLVLKVLEQKLPAARGAPSGSLWATRTVTANRVRNRIETVLAWAGARGYRTGDNPARWTGHLDAVLPGRGEIAKVEHHPALPYRQLPAFLADLHLREGSAARALELAIFTAARTGEVIGATWNEIDLGEAVWTVPANRIKGGIEHRVPLSGPALDLLRALPTEDGNPHVFVGPRAGGLSTAALNSVLQRMGQSEITVHGFRSTFRDWAAEQTNYAREVAERALAHKLKDQSEAAYARTDHFNKRRRLMADWARFCGNPHNAGGRVIRISGVRHEQIYSATAPEPNSAQ
jgi:integrase